MIAAFDIGNTNVKVFLIDDNSAVLARRTRPTPDLFEPDAWRVFFEELDGVHPGFASAEKRISCVNWKIFLALRVVFGYASADEFSSELPFDPSLMQNLPSDAPFVFEPMIPLDRPPVAGLIGTDRLLAAYALHILYQESFFVASLGTATTIDLVTQDGVFYGGVIFPGLDAAYGGLLARAGHLPLMADLPAPDKILGTDTFQALSAGVLVGHAVMLEGFFSRMRRDAALEGPVSLVLTGGRAYTVSPLIRMPHTVKEDLVALGLALVPAWYGDNAEPIELKELSHFLAYDPPPAVDESVYDFSEEIADPELHPVAAEKPAPDSTFRIHLDEKFLSDENHNDS